MCAIRVVCFSSCSLCSCFDLFQRLPPRSCLALDEDTVILMQEIRKQSDSTYRRTRTSLLYDLAQAPHPRAYSTLAGYGLSWQTDMKPKEQSDSEIRIVGG